jgi:hypothetical protein
MCFQSLHQINAANIKFAFMPTRFLPTHGLTHEKSGLARHNFFFVRGKKKRMI